MSDSKMLMRDVKADLKSRGISIRKQMGEYRVTFTGVEMIKRYGFGKSPEDVAYYTNDFRDAYMTGLHMDAYHHQRIVCWIEDSEVTTSGYVVRFRVIVNGQTKVTNAFTKWTSFIGWINQTAFVGTLQIEHR